MSRKKGPFKEIEATLRHALEGIPGVADAGLTIISEDDVTAWKGGTVTAVTSGTPNDGEGPPGRTVHYKTEKETGGGVYLAARDVRSLTGEFFQAAVGRPIKSRINRGIREVTIGDVQVLPPVRCKGLMH